MNELEIVLRKAVKDKGKNWFLKALDVKGSLMEELKKQKKTFEKLPSASVNKDEMLFVKFVTDMRIVPKGEGDKKKVYGFVDAILLIPWTCYDLQKKEEIDCEAGTKVTMNLARHGSLFKLAKDEKTLKDKEMCIVNLGKQKYYSEELGMNVSAFTYRLIPVDNVKEMIAELKEN